MHAVPGWPLLCRSRPERAHWLVRSWLLLPRAIVHLGPASAAVRRSLPGRWLLPARLQVYLSCLSPLFSTSIALSTHTRSPMSLPPAATLRRAPPAPSTTSPVAATCSTAPTVHQGTTARAATRPNRPDPVAPAGTALARPPTTRSTRRRRAPTPVSYSLCTHHPRAYLRTNPLPPLVQVLASRRHRTARSAHTSRPVARLRACPVWSAFTARERPWPRRPIRARRGTTVPPAPRRPRHARPAPTVPPTCVPM